MKVGVILIDEGTKSFSSPTTKQYNETYTYKLDKSYEMTTETDSVKWNTTVPTTGTNFLTVRDPIS